MKDQRIQTFRAMAIIAVVMVHTMPPGNWQIFLRPLINFPVATFLFLSGYLTRESNENWSAFYRRRLSRIAVPYIVWTVIYSLPDISSSGLIALAKNLVSANACGTLYYIFVYAQFVLLTPFLFKLAKSRYRYLGWLIAPVSVLLFKYYGYSFGIHMNKYLYLLWSDLCLGWFTFYYLGLLLGNKIINKKYNLPTLTTVYAVSIVLQMIEGYIWAKLDAGNCGSQLKLSSLLSSSIFVLILYTLLQSNTFQPRSRILTLIGEYSFGIYLSHILFIRLLEYWGISKTVSFPLFSVTVVSFSLIFCNTLDYLLGKKVSLKLGLI
mgnify:CR=1 FL=1